MTTGLMSIPVANPGDESEHPVFTGLTAADVSFGRLYMNSKRADVRAMMRKPTLAERVADSKALLQLADPPALDFEVDILGDPSGDTLAIGAYGAMVNREANGFHWVPPATMESLTRLKADEEYDREPYKRAERPNASALIVSIRPQDFPPAADLQAKPRPFSIWPRLNADGRGGVGSCYPAVKQDDVDGYESTWADLATGFVYEKVFRKMSASRPGEPLQLYKEWIRIK